MLGETLITEASQEISLDIMKELNYRLEDFKVNKQRSNWAEIAKNILTDNDSVYWYMEEPYKIRFGKVHHKHGIGNNNSWPIYLENDEEKCLVGHFAVMWPMFGDNCKAWLRTTEGDNL